MRIYRIVHHKRWIASDVKWSHWWTLETWDRRWWQRKPRWIAVREFQYDYTSPVVYRNLETAKKAAKHYKIKIQEAGNVAAN